MKTFFNCKIIKSYLALCIFVVCGLYANVNYERPIVAVMPSYNNESVCIKSLKSVMEQDYKNFFVIYIDDASNDNTLALVENYIEENSFQDKLLLIKNTERVGSLANLYQAIHLCKPEMIIVQVDGDDWLAHTQVFNKINSLYQDPDVWLTYGQFMYYPTNEAGWAAQVPLDIIKDNAFRDWTWVTTALRTFYAGLFHGINKEDLLYSGQFYPMSGDLAYMFCLLEQARTHIKFVPEIMYIYNQNSALSDHNVNRGLQYQLGLYIRKNKRYESVNEPYSGHYEKFYDCEKTIKHKKIYITPGYWGQLFAIDDPMLNRDNGLRPMYELREEFEKIGYQVVQANDISNLNDSSYILVFDVFPDQIEQLKKYPKEKLILFLWEPPSVLPNNYNPEYHQYFSKIFTFQDDLVDNEKYFKLYYPVFHEMTKELVSFENKKLCTSISMNKYSSHPDALYNERLKVINFFEELKTSDFDFYGKGWPAENYKNYKGPVFAKLDAMKNYKFCICYENIKGVAGYVTEKIFDCFWAGVVPIYWGAPNINYYVPQNCYVSRTQFNNEKELYDYLLSMSKEEYEGYLENIKSYLSSGRSKFFTINYFIKTLMHTLLEKNEIPDDFK